MGKLWKMPCTQKKILLGVNSWRAVGIDRGDKKQRAGAELDILKKPGPGRDRNFFYCRGRAGTGIFSLPGPGRDINFFYFRGRVFFIAVAGPGSEFFYCRSRAGIYILYCRGRGQGRAGIKNFEMTRTGPRLEKLKMPEPGPSQDRNLLSGPGFFFY